MPQVVVIAVALVSVLVALSIATRAGLTLDAVFKKFDGDANWDRFLGPGKIEDNAR